MVSETFKAELATLPPSRQELVRRYLEEVVPDYFWDVPASSSGKYHPSFAAGEGGLVRHTRMTIAVANALNRLDKYSSVDMEVVTAALLIHDTFKLGHTGRHYHTDHPQLAAEAFRDFANSCKDMELLKSFVPRVYNCVYLHMGQWSGKKMLDTLPTFHSYQPEAEIDIVKMADYIASQKFFDVSEMLE